MEKKITVALLSGGTSSEREVSLSGGDQVYHAIDKNRYDIFMNNSCKYAISHDIIIYYYTAYMAMKVLKNRHG